MVLSVLVRKTRIKDRAQWQSRLADALPRIRQVLEASSGFASLQYMWNVDEDGRFAQITAWQTLDDCYRYVREGAAAMVATIEDAVLPTAPHPDGAWVRSTYDVAEL